jgi:hypothetical protein
MYRSDAMRWFVKVQFMREGRPPIELGCEPIEHFPSETMIAQAMLVA